MSYVGMQMKPPKYPHQKAVRFTAEQEERIQYYVCQLGVSESDFIRDAVEKFDAGMQPVCDSGGELVDELREELTGKDAEIAALREELAGKDAELAELREKAGNRDELVTELRRHVDSLERETERLSAALEAAQEATRAAQTLHAAEKGLPPALAPREAHMGRWARLKAAWKG